MSDILFETANGRLAITLNRPDARNSLTEKMMGDIGKAIRTANSDPEVRVITLTGVGKSFCAGGDLKTLMKGKNPLQIRQLIHGGIRPMVRTIRTSDKPVITAVNGSIAGAGLTLALAADLVIASPSAKFVTAFGRIGAIPDAAILYLLAENLGMLRAKQMVLRVQSLEASEALQLGLYNEVVDDEQLGSRLTELATEIGSGPTMAHALAKQALHAATRLSFDAYMDLEASSQALLHTGFDHDEGVAAFVEKRPPEFRGY